MNPSIRPATPADQRVVVDFNARLAEESEGKTLDPQRLEPGVRLGLADAERSVYFIAEWDGAPCGQIMYTLEWSDWRNGWWWWIQSVYVKPEFRSRGVFSSLYRHLVALARSQTDVCGVRLYVEKENEHAQNVYRALGMEMTGYKVMELPFTGESETGDTEPC
ncbi:MAG: GNAT family N-acetyltransferase [Gammaproteobacteria bacterium]